MIKDKDIKTRIIRSTYMESNKNKRLFVPHINWDMVGKFTNKSANTLLIYLAIHTGNNFNEVDKNGYCKLPKSILKILNINPSRMTIIVKELEEMGVVKTKREPGKKTRFKLVKNKALS